MTQYKEVAEILSLLDSSSCEEFVLETEGIKLVVRRGPSGGPAAEGTLIRSEPRPVGQALAPVQPAASTQNSAASPVGSINSSFVGAPMVGTFYRAPSPDKPPFVEVGTVVKIGDPLCVIEVMKLFTTIHAEVEGTIRQIGAEDGQFVEYGQMIFTIE